MSRISLRVGETEVTIEGDDDFVAANLEQSIEKCMKMAKQMPDYAPSKDAVVNGALPIKPDKTRSHSASKKTSKKPKTSREELKIVEDLNLRPKDEQSLRDFCAEKSPASALEATTVFVYYLQKILRLDDISLSHIYTCYKEVKMPVPARLNQNIIDTVSRKGSIVKAPSGSIKMTVSGENFVEYDLPRKVKDGQ